MEGVAPFRCSTLSLNEVRPGRPEQCIATEALKSCLNYGLNEVRPRRPEQFELSWNALWELYESQ